MNSGYRLTIIAIVCTYSTVAYSPHSGCVGEKKRKFGRCIGL